MKAIIFATAFMAVASGAALMYHPSASVATSATITDHLKPKVNYEDAANAVVLGFRQQVKVMYYESNIRVETTGKVDSQIWDAQIYSWAVARVQVYVDSTCVAKQKITHVDGALILKVPKACLSRDVIPTGEVHTNNRSWGFFIRPTWLRDVVESNHQHLANQLTDAGNATLAEHSEGAVSALHTIADPIVKASGLKMVIEITD